MKALLSLGAALVIAISVSAMVGCESMHHRDSEDSSSMNRSQTSGGNGSYGETTAKPGTYNTNNGAGGNTNSNTGNNR